MHCRNVIIVQLCQFHNVHDERVAYLIGTLQTILKLATVFNFVVLRFDFVQRRLR